MLWLNSALWFAFLAAGTPIGTVEDYARSLEDRHDLSEQDFTSIKYYVQHAAAAYCNFNADPGKTVICGKNACPLVQRNKATVVDSFVGQYTGIGAYVAVDKIRKEIVLSVRGSNNIRNFITDIIFAWQRCDFVNDCKVHTGFAKSWEEIQDSATRAMKTARDQYPGYRLVATGHSLGGSVATLGAAYMRRNGFPVDVYTYGSPRVGNDAFANWMTSQPGGQWRITHDADPVPRLPPIFVGYRHISPEYWLSNGRDSQNDYPISQVEVCRGIANTECNGGTFGLDVTAHLHYLGDTSGCSGFPLKWKRDDVSIRPQDHRLDGWRRDDPSNEELEQRLNEWSQKDQEFVKNGTK
ncbi:hypothetical protein QQS21_002728 [Conoideocrella luteorostrata]|uniref:Fungal lipase-type domain-containing protein n=1 Tax=Conoideocrella luteorostrata TaxID=1105319 RepID=A0AAJ0CX70_9HYPO|nr:hypothetical protein QQS21_002728 [Conoideocrella luteorostrata]